MSFLYMWRPSNDTRHRSSMDECERSYLQCYILSWLILDIGKRTYNDYIMARADSHRAAPCHTWTHRAVRTTLSHWAKSCCTRRRHRTEPRGLRHYIGPCGPCHVTPGCAVQHHTLFTDMVRIILVRILYIDSLNLVRILVHRLVGYRL